jgi:hypothetical protein
LQSDAQRLLQPRRGQRHASVRQQHTQHNPGTSDPHPFEREKVKSLILPDGVRLDSHADIYSSLKESSVVISELSTGLFEAVGLVDKVLLWETDKSRFAFPEIPFKSF